MPITIQKEPNLTVGTNRHEGTSRFSSNTKPESCKNIRATRREGSPFSFGPKAGSVKKLREKASAHLSRRGTEIGVFKESPFTSGKRKRQNRIIPSKRLILVGFTLPRERESIKWKKRSKYCAPCLSITHSFGSPNQAQGANSIFFSQPAFGCDNTDRLQPNCNSIFYFI